MQLQRGRGGAFPGLVLSPLYDGCMLPSQERRETYDAIAGELCGYGLRWQGGTADARALCCKTDSLALYSVRCGDEVIITPDAYPEFFRVHLCLMAWFWWHRSGLLLASDTNCSKASWRNGATRRPY